MLQRIADIFSDTIQLATEWIQRLNGWSLRQTITANEDRKIEEARDPMDLDPQNKY